MYTVDDFIYKRTLETLYNLPPEWIAQLGAPDKQGKHPRSRRQKSLLYYRPRVEALILANVAAYRQMLSRARPAQDEQYIRAQQTNLQTAQRTPIIIANEAMPTVPIFLQTIRRLRVALFDQVYCRPIDVTDWYPTPDEMFTYFLVYHTNYLAQLKPFIGQPGAGLCFLALRQTAEPVVIECLTQFAWVNRIDGHSPWRN